MYNLIKNQLGKLRLTVIIVFWNCLTGPNPLTTQTQIYPFIHLAIILANDLTPHSLWNLSLCWYWDQIIDGSDWGLSTRQHPWPKHSNNSLISHQTTIPEPFTMIIL